MMAQGARGREARRATTPSSRATRAIRTPTSCSPGMHGSAEARDGRRQDQERRRVLYRRLEAGQRAEEHGADPHQEQQQGRRGRRRERRHGRRRRRGAGGAGHGGSVPVSGQDGDHAAINRIALGTQTVSIWKDARDLGKIAGEAAVALADGKKMTDIPGVKPFAGGTEGRQGQRHPADAAPDHQGQSQRGHRQGLDHQGRSLRRREAGRCKFGLLSLTARRGVTRQLAASLRNGRRGFLVA